MLVGDSIMRNQWESLVCLVQGVIPTGQKTVTYNGPSMAFHAMVRTLLRVTETVRDLDIWKLIISLFPNFFL